ncbi:MAG TPA: winged helix-turn-helix domain-containing protein [Terriglobales bacterium]
MSSVVRFGSYEVDLSAGQLRKRGIKINLPDQSFRVLASLLVNPGEVVTREELQRRLWHNDVFVDFENNLNTVVARLREALCDSADHPRFIETLPKRGYRFIADMYALPARTAESQTNRARLMLLPFVNLSGDPAQEYFSDAMTDEIITALASLAPEQLAVIARTTAMHYKGSHKDVARIGRELNVEYVVEGGVRRTEDRVAINVQLIQASNQTHLFAKKYDAEMRDVFSLHSCIAQAIARHVPAIAHGMRDGIMLREQVRRKPTEDLAAYDEYIKGRYEMWKMTPESVAKARQHFEAALDRDPEFALACDGLAELYWYLGFWGYAPSRETDAVGRFYVVRAIETDPTLADTHALLSFYPKKRHYSDEFDYYDWAEMQKDLAHARELNPSSRLVRLRYAIVLMILGRIEDAAAELERALESDPLALDVRFWFATMLYLGRQYDRALEQCLRLVELEPDRFLPYYALGHIYMAMQRFDESAAALRNAVEASRELPLVLGLLGLSLGLGGCTAEARTVLDRLRALASKRYVPPTCFAWTHLGLGEIDEAFVWMDRAIDAPDRMIKPIKTYPFLDPLRTDPRFAALLRKMNLEA